ncbi:phosphatidylcholine/phosphatidylserine synthase [Apibacter sp. wkB309]|uniref:CDP-alcohol phosphatidyltransferase family protein n=1 Tax=Apibacter sp. wkB309 TaxID=1679467 RepID=UPI000CFA2396|nr:CDP-alcohol phosphatidyltransferase family protein [Apibacter sp. wkB309]PQL92779.1 hypothetical protein C4S75_00430 [Apibacter sp. wkB309]
MKYLPNTLTLANLLCGSIACILTIIKAPIEYILILLLCSLIFDFFDGFAARLAKVSGPFGKELDSLADIVTFGVLPGLFMFTMLGGDDFYSRISTFSNGFIHNKYIVLFPFFGLLITLFSALRLAKFNLDEEQSYYFKGLPTPANTILIFSLYYLHQNHTYLLLDNSWFLLFITVLSSYLLVANIPLLAFKFKNLTWKDNSLVYSFLIICIVLLIFLKISAIPILILIYLILSIIFRKKIISNGTKTT